MPVLVLVPRSTYTSGSDPKLARRIDEEKLSNISYQLRLVCLKPYKFLSIPTSTWMSEPTLRCPSRQLTVLGNVTFISSLTLLSRKAILTSKYFIVILAPPKTARSRRNIAILTNCSEVLSMSITGYCQNPCVTTLVLLHLTFSP